MAKLAAVVVGLLCLVALGQSAGRLYSRTWTTSGTASFTGAAPTSDSDGIDLSGATGWQVTVSNVTQDDGGVPALLGGAGGDGGTVACYFYAPVSASGGAVTRRWHRCDSSLDVTALPGQRDYTAPAFISPVGSGRLKYVPIGVVSDGGASLGVTVEVRRAK